MRDRLPDAPEIIETWQNQIPEDSDLLPRANEDHISTGIAIEMRIGLDLSEDAPYRELLGGLSPDSCRFVLRACGLRKDDASSSATNLFDERWYRTSQTNELDLIEHAVLETCFDLAGVSGVTHGFQSREEKADIVRVLLKHYEISSNTPAPDRLINAWDTYLQRGRSLFYGTRNPHGNITRN